MEKLLKDNSKSTFLDRSALLSQDMSDVITRPDAARQLRWVTSFGFEIGGPIAEKPQQFEEVVKNRSSIILWKKDFSHRRILVATNGHSITLPYSPKILMLLKKISRGKRVNRSKNSRDVHNKGSKIFETHWNKQCQLKTRKLTSVGDHDAYLIQWLLRVYAVEGVQAK